jgi:acyl-CoA thioester hydrolase
MGADEPYQGRFEGAEHRFACRVYFEDTDLSGVVYHANYLRWMERARSDMLRLVGIDQRRVHEDGWGAYAVAAVAIRYAAPARFDDAVVVTSRVIKATTARVVIQQRVSRDGLLLTEAEVTAALVGPDGRPRRQPAAWLSIYQRLIEEGNA